MTLHVRPTCGTWAVFLPLADGKHVDKIYTGTNEDCNAFAEFFQTKARQDYSLFGIDEDDLAELREEFHKSRKNAFFDWLTDGKRDNVTDLLYR